jgi:hypothetical protein
MSVELDSSYEVRHGYEVCIHFCDVEEFQKCFSVFVLMCIKMSSHKLFSVNIQNLAGDTSVLPDYSVLCGNGLGLSSLTSLKISF